MQKPLLEHRVEPVLTVVTNPSKRRTGKRTLNPVLFALTNMDWPHDPDSDEGSEGMRKYGLAILAKKVDEDDNFPLSKDDFQEAVGHHPIRIDYETVVSVDDIVGPVEVDEFEDLQSFHQTLGDTMREEGYWTYESGETDESE